MYGIKLTTVKYFKRFFSQLGYHSSGIHSFSFYVGCSDSTSVGISLTDSLTILKKSGRLSGETDVEHNITAGGYLQFEESFKN